MLLNIIIRHLHFFYFSFFLIQHQIIFARSIREKKKPTYINKEDNITISLKITENTSFV